MSVADSKKPSSKGLKPRNDRVKLTRDEKDEFINWLATEFGEATMRAAWLEAKVLPKARNLILKAARGGAMAARAKCVEEASAAVDDILNKTVATALDPETACECLGACDAGDRARAAVGSIECALCEAAVEATDAVLKLNATQAALEKLADEACAALGPLAGTCEKLFAGSIDGMVQCEVATALAPATFCAC